MQKTGLFLACLLSASVLADESKIYLLATLRVGGPDMAKSILLHEPEITDLQTCAQAINAGQQKNDWLHYHHILQRDKIKGFTAQTDYRCVRSDLLIEQWYDRDRYDYTYLIGIAQDSTLQVRQSSSLANCHTALKRLSAAQQAQSFCTRGNQKIVH